MRGTERYHQWAAKVVLALVLGAAGCVHLHDGPVPSGLTGGVPPISVPPDGAVPRELVKITLPPYVIESPDILLIEVIVRSKVPIENDPKDPQPKAPVPKDAEGKAAMEKDEFIRLPVQPVSGSFQVRIDGTVGLGIYGSTTVAGLTLEQASETIRQHLAKHPLIKHYGFSPDNIFVMVDVLAYNSKWYYVVTDGGGAGEQVFKWPVTGSECVLDAIANIYGLPAVASKRNIWVARRCPLPNHPDQILPVDWVGITQHGQTFTNYQIMPGDRIYVKAQRMVTIDTMLARFLSPIERLFGVTLLGANTVNQISGRGISGSGQ